MAYPETTKFKKQENLIESIKKVLVDDYFNAIEIIHIEDPTQREERVKYTSIPGLFFFYVLKLKMLLTLILVLIRQLNFL